MCVACLILTFHTCAMRSFWCAHTCGRRYDDESALLLCKAAINVGDLARAQSGCELAELLHPWSHDAAFSHGNALAGAGAHLDAVSLPTLPCRTLRTDDLLEVTAGLPRPPSLEGGGDDAIDEEATHQWPLGMVACRPRFPLTDALLMMSSHSEGRGVSAGGKTVTWQPRRRRCNQTSCWSGGGLCRED